ncbi:putative transposase [Escherichia coli 2-460-02_S3_C1]|nr:putative transposase [Escherichia coli 2-460-02_S3_C1]
MKPPVVTAQCSASRSQSINGLYKAEVIHRKSWKNRAEVELATLTVSVQRGPY